MIIMDDYFEIVTIVCIVVIAICSMYIGCVIEEINNKITSNCITVENKIYCERGGE